MSGGRPKFATTQCGLVTTASAEGGADARAAFEAPNHTCWLRDLPVCPKMRTVATPEQVEEELRCLRVALTRISHTLAAHLANHLAASGFVLRHHINLDMPWSSSPPGDQSITQPEPSACEWEIGGLGSGSGRGQEWNTLAVAGPRTHVSSSLLTP